MTAPIPIKGKRLAPVGATAVPKRHRTDWEAVERDFRATDMTLRELADKYKCLHTSIANKAKRDKWTRDLSGAVKQATATALIEASIACNVNKREQDVTNVVLATAEINKNVIIGHRTGLVRLTEVKRKLLEQIEQAASNMVDLAEVIEMARNPDENGLDRANDALKKAMGRSALVDDLKKLADVDERVRKGEREAFNLDDKSLKDAKSDTMRLTDAERAVRLMDMLASRKPSEPDTQRRAA